MTIRKREGPGAVASGAFEGRPGCSPFRVFSEGPQRTAGAVVDRSRRLEMLAELAEQRVSLVRGRRMDLHTAVDGLAELAARFEINCDTAQAIIAGAFRTLPPAHEAAA